MLNPQLFICSPPRTTRENHVQHHPRHLRATAIHCPLERMVLETDAPYLAKEPFDIPSLAEKIAELRLRLNLKVNPVQKWKKLRIWL